ncbi:MAG: hypothetical protein HKN54_00735 [Flavobacteriaceae bacterium]|nr:hypothetical protein [Flavobacteriaceae bacterium]
MWKSKLVQFVLVQTIVMEIIGLIAGILYAFGGLIIDALVSFGWITTNETPGLSYGTILAFGALVGMPLIFAIVGFLLGLVEALFYKLVLMLFRGMKLAGKL